MKFETRNDRDIEDQVATAIGVALKCTMVRCEGEFSSSDFWAMKGDIKVALIEMKCRRNSSTKYPTIVFATSKRKTLLQEATQANVIPMFAVAFSDGMIYGMGAREAAEYDVGVISRVKSRMSGGVGIHDVELAHYIPIADMRPITTIQPYT